MFVTDKHGQKVFFPWRSRGKGYILMGPDSKQKIEIFLVVFIWISILFVSVSSIIFGLVGNFFFFTGMCLSAAINWLVIYFLIIEIITKHMQFYPTSYKEVVLDNLSSDDEEAPKT